MRKLNEIGMSEDITCPYCGYPSALEEYESRNEEYYNLCSLCGWEETKYGYYDDDDKDIVMPNEKVIKLAKKIMKEIYKKLDNNTSNLFWHVMGDMPKNDQLEQEKALIDFKHEMIKKVSF